MFHSDCNPESELDALLDLDWQNHSGSVPYEVIFDSNEGRYLRATRDFKQGVLKSWLRLQMPRLFGRSVGYIQSYLTARPLGELRR